MGAKLYLVVVHDGRLLGALAQELTLFDLSLPYVWET